MNQMILFKVLTGYESYNPSYFLVSPCIKLRTKNRSDLFVDTWRIFFSTKRKNESISSNPFSDNHNDAVFWKIYAIIIIIISKQLILHFQFLVTFLFMLSHPFPPTDHPLVTLINSISVHHLLTPFLLLFKADRRTIQMSLSIFLCFLTNCVSSWVSPSMWTPPPSKNLFSVNHSNSFTISFIQCSACSLVGQHNVSWTPAPTISQNL